ncbi:MAG TPA: hypothetical protein VHC44_12965, partial [Verrucomicrobiae bacterium]|nr:hypothetical protein [Verrucomicrobiae bacterium]
MKTHFGLRIFLVVAGCWIGFLPTSRAQSATPNPAQIPRPAVAQPVAATQPPPGTLDDYLKFDSDAKSVSVTNGTEQAHFSFSVTNVSSESVIINY